MVRIRNLLFYTFFMLWSVEFLNAQSIRKDHREMTPSEKRVYRDAVIARKDFHMEEAVHHADHFSTEIHTTGLTINGVTQLFNGTQFLSWHRLFLLEVEDKLRTSGITNAVRISLPYWNWVDENSSSNVTWGNAGFLDIPTLQNAGFVFDHDGDQRVAQSPTPRIPIRRSISSSSFVNSGNIDDMINGAGITSFIPTSFQSASQSSDFFSKRLEHWHNRGHGFVASSNTVVGTMNTAESPADPVFYLHHNFVDKLWQDWEDKENTVKSSFPTPATAINDWPGTDPNNTTDSRHLVVNLKKDNASFARSFDVRYASQKKLLLDGLNGDFRTSSTETLLNAITYCYVAWNGSSVEGTIYAGDVQRDGNNIIADNKGGFIIDADTDFSAGSAIELLPGFSTEGSVTFTAQIVDRPCGFSSNNFTGGGNNDDAASLKAANSTTSSNGTGKVYPNPFGDALNVAYEVDEDTPLSIQLVNALGQTIWQQNFGIQAKGAFQTTIPTTDLAKGLYTVLIKTNSGQKVFKAVH